MNTLSRVEQPKDCDYVGWERSEEHTSELQSQSNLVCRLLLEKKKQKTKQHLTTVALKLGPEVIFFCCCYGTQRPRLLSSARFSHRRQLLFAYSASWPTL